MKTAQSALALIIYICVVGMVLLGFMTYFYVSHSPETVSKIIEALGGIVLLVGGAKAGLSLPASDPSAPSGTTNVTQYTTNKPEDTPEPK